MISQITSRSTVKQSLDAATPQPGPKRPTKIIVAKLEIVILTRLFPINIAATTLSNLVIKRRTQDAPLTPLSARCRARILLKAISEASLAEKKKENTDNTAITKKGS